MIAFRCGGVWAAPCLFVCTLLGCGGEEFTQSSPTGAGELDGGVSDGGATPGPVPIPRPILEASVIGGVSVLPPGGLVTSEGGDQASFEIVLVDEPSGQVRIPLESSDPSEGTILVTELVFAPNTWNVPQTVVITGQDDDDVDGNQGYLIQTLPAISTDPQYEGVDAADIAVANLDDDEVGVRFTPFEGLTTTEDGGQANFTVRLTSKPTGEVAVFLESADTTEGTVSPAVLTFSTDNWNSPRMVTATGVDDDEPDGAKDYAIVISNIVSADENYGDHDASSVSVSLRNTDNDSAGVSVSPDQLEVSELGTTATFEVVLNREPSDVVLIRVASSDESEGTVVPALLTFTTDNWNAPQEVVATGVNDDEADGDQTFPVELQDALSTDPAYNGLAIPDVSVTTIDDEASGFLVSPREVTVSEDGTMGSFGIRPTTRPSAEVVVSLSVNVEGEATLSAEQVTFGPDDWETPKTVTVTGVDDDETDGDQEFLIQLSPAQSEDDNYRGLDPPNVTGLNMDNDTAAISVVPVMGLTTSEDGTTAEFVVTLNAPPTDRVRVSLQSSDDTEGEVMPTEVEFDADNWNEAQAVLVTGIDDATTDGAQPYTIITEIVSEDEGYAELLVADVSVLNLDDECPVPQIIDDLEDENLMICPSQGRTGAWLAENGPAGTLDLAVGAADRAGSDFALMLRGATGDIAELPTGGGLLASYPVAAVNFGGAAAGSDGEEPDGFDASAYSGVGLWARASVEGRLTVAVVTRESAAGNTGAVCSHGCTGHFTTAIDIGTEWRAYELPFADLSVDGAREVEFSSKSVLGLKLTFGADGSYEYWVDDLGFMP